MIHRMYLQSAKRRIFAKVEKIVNGCWNWCGNTNKRKDGDKVGYGIVSFRGHHHYVHRLMYQFEVGPITSGLDVMHLCDNPRCCNPEHLQLGTRKENMADAVRKGRVHPGERHGMSKLTERQVIEIWNRWHAGEKNRSRLAEDYKITEGAVRSILVGRTWGWLTRQL